MADRGSTSYLDRVGSGNSELGRALCVSGMPHAFLSHLQYKRVHRTAHILAFRVRFNYVSASHVSFNSASPTWIATSQIYEVESVVYEPFKHGDCVIG